MASMSTALCLLQFHHQSSVSLMPSIYKSKHRRISSSVAVNGGVEMKFHFGSSSTTSCCCCCLSWNPRKLVEQSFLVRGVNSSLGTSSSSSSSSSDVDKQRAAAAAAGDGDVEIMQGGDNHLDSKDLVSRFRETLSSTTLNNPAVLVVKQQLCTNFAVILCIAIACLVIAVREYIGRKSRHNHHGSVADLVKRGQLRSDRRGISKPLKYDDPFNNPLVKVSKNSSTVEMCGKVYRLAPVTLTQEEQSDHQKRRSRAYQWKRPTMFLKEGESLPPDVDPDTVRWIPANHPFATTVNDIDEDLAQNNVYQKHGVPFRIKAEHEALQKKLESLQSEQKLNKLVVDPHNARDFERPFKSSSKSHEHVDRRTTSSQGDDPNTPKSDRTIESSPTDASSSEELKKP